MRVAFLPAIGLAALLALPLGCQESQNQQAGPSGENASPQTQSGMPNDDIHRAFAARPNAGMPMGGQVPPFAGGGPMAGKSLTPEEALKVAPTLDPNLAPLKKAMETAEANWKHNPADPQAKAAYVEATYQYGHAVMEDGQKQPRIMYRAALALYRRALAVDPGHKPSLEDKQLIESIYQSMGMPIPK
ncbi:MAG TPA: hypothetical protein VFB38_04950 [Chthonomonadaceae bacterium]|nr:hypothetical protein [Chthonomonadaceae bacterium]